MLKKSLSVFLCIVMCISFFSMTVVDTLAAYDVKTLFSVKGEPVEDNKLNYSISVTKEQKNIGGIILVVEYDSTVLKPGKCEPGKKTTTQEGTTQNFKGTYVYGVSETPGLYTIAYMNDMAVSTTEALTFFNIEFEVIDKTRPKTTVNFYCKEYYSTSETDKNITVADGLQLIASFEDISTLAKPVLKGVVPHKDGLEVSWEAVEGAIGYEIRRTSPHNTWESVGEIGADQTTFVDTGLTSGTDYTYTVRAFNNSGVSLYDAIGVTCTYIEKPVVTSLRNAVGGVEIKWSETQGADFYVVLRRQVGETQWEEVAKRTYSAGTVYKDTTVVDGIAYEYDVNSATDSFTSVTSDVGMSLTYISTPEIESVSNTLKGIKITWKAHADATHYIIYKKTVGIDSELLEYSVSSQNYFEDKDGTNVATGKTYTYAVKACTNDGESAYSVTGYTITRVPPTNVTSLSLEKNAINVQWESVSGVTGYVIYRRSVSETKWTKAGVVDKTQNSFSDTGVISGGEYIYAVCPMISVSEGAKIESSSIYYISAPENIVAENIIEGIKVTWKTVNGATKYEVSRVNSDGSFTALTQINASETLEYIDENVEWGKEYSYAVKAISPKGESLVSVNTSSIIRIGAIGIATPEIADGGIRVTWDAVADADGYAVFRNDDGNWVQITTVNETEYIDANVKSAKVYSYAVAVIIEGSRGIVNTENAPQLKYIAPPETVTALNGENFVKISWSAVEGAVKYEVYKTENAETIPYSLVATVDGETLSFLDKRVATGKTYNYVVRALDGEKTSVNSAVTTHIFLSVPAITKIANDYKGVTIKWNSVAGASEYYIYSKVKGGKWSCIDTVKGDVNTYTDKNAVNGKVMYYTVKAVNGDSISSFETKTISYISAPKVTVSNVAKGVKIKWNADENAINYRVYRKAGNAKSWSLIATVKTNTYTDTKAKNGVDYKYTVRANNGEKYSGYNPDGWKIRFLTAPKLNSAVNGYGFIKFSWQRVAGAEGYKVYRKYNGGKEWTYLGKTTALSYKDKDVKNKASYTYTVRAYYGSKMSAYNTSGKTVKYLIAPTVTVENRVEGVQLNWNTVSGAASYYVYRKAGNDTSWKKIATVTKNTYIDTKVSSGTTYKYTVRAYGSKTLSGFYSSGWKIVYLSAPELVSAKSYKSGITVKWKPVKKATGYFIFRKEGNGAWIQVGKVDGQKVVTYRDKTAEMGGKYTYTVRAYYGNYRSWFYSGLTCIDKY